MAFRFSDSFDHYTTAAQVPLKWSSVGSPANIIPVAGGRNGTQALYNTSSNARTINKVLDNQPTWIVGIAFKWVTILTATSSFYIECLQSSTAQVGVYINGDGTLSVRRGGSGGTILGTTVNSLSSSTWYYIEFKILIDNSGTYSVHVNGVDWLTGTGDTQNTANNYANQIQIMAGLNSQSYFDDAYICDGTTGDDPSHPNNDFLGDVRIVAIFPDAIGTYSQWTPTSGDNYTCVDETTPNDDSDYVATSGIGNIDTYNFESLPVSSGTVLAIQCNSYARKDDAGSRSIGNAIYYNSILYSGSEQSVGDTYRYYPEIFEVNPNTNVRWTISELNSVEIGPKLEE